MKIFSVISLLLLSLLSLIAAPAEGPREVMATNSSGRLVTPTNFFYTNLLPGANVTIQRLPGGRIAVHATGSFTNINQPNITLTNISALATTLTNQSNYVVMGYRVPGDGGGGEFYLDKNSTAATNIGTVFEANGGGRFVRLFTDTIFWDWFGARADGSDDSAAIQAAVNFCLTNGVSKCYGTPGKSYTISNNFILIGLTNSGGTYSFVGNLKFGSDSPAFRLGTAGANQAPKLIQVSSNLPAVVVQCVRDVEVAGLTVLGKNDVSLTTDTWPKRIWPTNWVISPNIRTNAYSPYAGVVIDPFVSTVVGPNQYPGMTRFYFNPFQGSVDVSVHDCQFENWYTAIALPGPVNSDSIRVERVYFYLNTIGFAVGNSQARASVLRDCQAAGLFNLVNCFAVGDGIGSPPNIEAGEYSQIVRLFNIRTDWGFSPIIAGVYAEDFLSFGGFTAGGNASGQFTFVGGEYHLHDGNITDDYHILTSAPILFLGTTIVTDGGQALMIYTPQGGGAGTVKVIFHAASLRSTTQPYFEDKIAAFDPLTIVLHDSEFYGNISVGDANIGRHRVWNNVNELQGKPFWLGSTFQIGTATYYLDTGLATLDLANIGNVTLNGDGTATFTNSTPNIVKPGDILYDVQTATWPAGHIFSTISASDSVNGLSSLAIGRVYGVTNNTVYLRGVPQRISSTTNIQGRINLFTRRFRQGSSGRLVSGLNIVSNVSDIAYYMAGQRIRGTGIIPGSWITNVDNANNRFFLSTNAIASGTNALTDAIYATFDPNSITLSNVTLNGDTYINGQLLGLSNVTIRGYLYLPDLPLRLGTNGFQWDYNNSLGIMNIHSIANVITNLWFNDNDQITNIKFGSGENIKFQGSTNVTFSLNDGIDVINGTMRIGTAGTQNTFNMTNQSFSGAYTWQYPSGSGAGKVWTSDGTGYGFWDYSTNAAGSVTNAISVVKTDGLTITNQATALNLIAGTNITLVATNQGSGLVDIQINSLAQIFTNSNSTISNAVAGSNFVFYAPGAPSGAGLTNFDFRAAARVGNKTNAIATFWNGDTNAMSIGPEGGIEMFTDSRVWQPGGLNKDQVLLAFRDLSRDTNANPSVNVGVYNPAGSGNGTDFILSMSHQSILSQFDTYGGNTTNKAFFGIQAHRTAGQGGASDLRLWGFVRDTDRWQLQPTTTKASGDSPYYFDTAEYRNATYAAAHTDFRNFGTNVLRIGNDGSVSFLYSGITNGDISVASDELKIKTPGLSLDAFTDGGFIVQQRNPATNQYILKVADKLGNMMASVVTNSGYAGGGNKFLSDNGTYQTVSGTGSETNWTRANGQLTPTVYSDRVGVSNLIVRAVFPKIIFTNDSSAEAYTIQDNTGALQIQTTGTTFNVASDGSTFIKPRNNTTTNVALGILDAGNNWMLRFLTNGFILPANSAGGYGAIGVTAQTNMVITNLAGAVNVKADQGIELWALNSYVSLINGPDGTNNLIFLDTGFYPITSNTLTVGKQIRPLNEGHFQTLLLSGNTNRYTDNGTTLLRNGIPFTAGGGGAGWTNNGTILYPDVAAINDAFVITNDNSGIGIGNGGTGTAGNMDWTSTLFQFGSAPGHDFQILVGGSAKWRYDTPLGNYLPETTGLSIGTNGNPVGTVVSEVFIAESATLPGILELDGTNNVSQVRLTLNPDATQTNEIRFDIKSMTANQVLSAHSVTAFGPTNRIVLTNSTPAFTNTLAAGWGSVLETNGATITISPTNHLQLFPTNATSATVDFSDAANFQHYAAWWHLTTNLVVSPTNLVVGRTIMLRFPTNSLTYDVTITNTAAVPILWNFNVATNGSTSFTKTNTLSARVYLTAETNGVVSAEMGYYR